MTEPMSKAEANRQAEEHAQSITAFFGMILMDEEPGVIGLVLAELMSAFLASHIIKTDAAAEAKLRQTLLAQWCETVWALTALKEGRSETKQ